MTPVTMQVPLVWKPHSHYQQSLERNYTKENKEQRPKQIETAQGSFDGVEA